MPAWRASVHVLIESTNLVTVHVLLVEEALTSAASVIALLFTILTGTVVVVGTTIAWVSIADTVTASISEGDLTILWTVVHPVYTSVTFKAVLNNDCSVGSGEEEKD